MKKDRIGVYVCWCGGNISDVVDVQRVSDAVKDFPGVVISKNLMFVCSDAGQKEIYDDIKDHKLNGVVVASCSPKLHELTFMNTVERAGLNRFEFYHVNIREDVSWAHSDDPIGATEKAIREVKAGINYVRLTQPLEEVKVSIYNKVLIIGGGIAGLRSAVDAAKVGTEVILVEKLNRLGGSACQIATTYPDGESGREVVNEFLREIRDNKEKIQIFRSSELSSISGYVGNFEIEIKNNETNKLIKEKVGAVIIATGFFFL
jgi:heterodisulfide reductase subunit A